VSFLPRLFSFTQVNDLELGCFFVLVLVLALFLLNVFFHLSSVFSQLCFELLRLSQFRLRPVESLLCFGRLSRFFKSHFVVRSRASRTLRNKIVDLGLHRTSDPLDSIQGCLLVLTRPFAYDRCCFRHHHFFFALGHDLIAQAFLFSDLFEFSLIC
jgi:hypothetical protein